jgi:3-amino-5-hydroxybenzoate synthase
MTREPALLGGTPIYHDPPQWPRATPAVIDNLRMVAESGHWWQSGGGAAEQLEAQLKQWFGVADAVAISSGSAGLFLSLVALGTGPGHEVLVPATTFVATAAAVSLAGATPVPVDVDPRSLLVDLDRAAEAITDRTAALVVVHLGGAPADLAAARSLADKYRIALVEDSAQALTASTAGQRVGTVGDAAVLSFQAGKLLPAGDGGALLAPKDAPLAALASQLANNGRPRGSGEYLHAMPALNLRITEWAAAVALGHMAGYEELRQLRENTAAILISELDRVDPIMPVRAEPRVTVHDHYMVMVRLPRLLRDAGISNATFAAALVAEGIPAKVLFPPWYATGAYAHREFAPDHACPASEAAAAEVICLPHFLLLDPRIPSATAEAIARLIGSVTGLVAWQGGVADSRTVTRQRT